MRIERATASRGDDVRPDDPGDGGSWEDRDVTPSATCVFCEIVEGSTPAHLVYQDEAATAFLDRRPLFAGHALVVPRRHVVTLGDLSPDEVGPFFERVRHLSATMPSVLGCEGTFVANNNIVSQSVSHLHVHVVPRTKGDGLRGFFWPRTTYADGEAEALAPRMRAVFEART